MGRALVLAMLVFVAPTASSGQTLVVLHIRAVLVDAAGTATPVARHALLISDNPPTREPRRVVTRADGTLDVRLRPGSYTVESDQPVAFQGKAFRWTQTLDVVAGRDSALELTVANAKTEPLEPGADGTAPIATDPWLALRQWLDGVVELWTPTAHASGFLVSADGLIATNQKVVGDATTVEVQLSRSVKVTGIVLEADRERDVAVVRIDPALMAAIKPVPLACASTGTPETIARGQEIFTLAAPLRQQKGITFGTVTRVAARAIALDLRVATGGLGGPAFTAAGDVVGVTSPSEEREERSRDGARIVRLEDTCAVVAAAARKASSALAPTGTRLPVEPATAVSIDSLKEAVKRRAGSLKPYQMQSSDFDVAFMTPVLTYNAQSQPNQDFGNWSEYVADNPPVLFVRVTPKMVESLWAKMARGAAYTQGMALPPIKRLGSGFHRLHAFCGNVEVTPIHPLKLERRVSETEAIYEGLYAFDPAALGPACGTVKLVLHSEKEPEKGDSRVVEPAILRQIWRDFGLDSNP
jgi:hypothetical protein